LPLRGPCLWTGADATIVGAAPAGLSTSIMLSRRSVPDINVRDQLRDGDRQRFD
jgi:thioredoxin reductase